MQDMREKVSVVRTSHEKETMMRLRLGGGNSSGLGVIQEVAVRFILLTVQEFR